MNIMTTIGIPKLSEVSIENKNYIDYFNKKLGRIPNIYAAMMHSENAFITYYPFHTHKISLSIKECVGTKRKSGYCLYREFFF